MSTLINYPSIEPRSECGIGFSYDGELRGVLGRLLVQPILHLLQSQMALAGDYILIKSRLAERLTYSWGGLAPSAE